MSSPDIAAHQQPGDRSPAEHTEAVRRAQMRTNKQIARLLKNRVSAEYAGKKIALYRREYEANHPHDDDSFNAS